MALVKYSDSESDADQLPTKRLATNDAPEVTKKRRIERKPTHSESKSSSLPPLPAEFRDLYATSSRISVQDDPGLHDGRKRVIPHVVGNWPTHIYLEWYPTTAELALLADVVSKSADRLQNGPKIHSLLYSDLGAQLPLHISLSRPIVLVTEERHAFSALMESEIKDWDIRPFDITVEGLDWVSNFERTRWFLVLRPNRPSNDGLNSLLRLCNRSLAAFNQPPLYDNTTNSSTRGCRKGQQTRTQRPAAPAANRDFSGCFHLSIAWSLEEPTPDEKQRVADINLDKLREIKVPFNSIKLKIGNNIHNLPLPTTVISEGGFVGL
ncbi:hypothetical protein AJ80_05223 [Polytolypa hystricis UAMH7299]|uniref:U6 snRNA phosphodiesterase n=1 Tax=Polytolypa hystricis (strain UAMH7299) TaxID=1447883 RepID=A0A2B7Y5S4_POLH7|nr:hypothetical protein AJ80_05223 [Polytolypa hystricis UAMH7299]